MPLHPSQQITATAATATTTGVGILSSQNAGALVHASCGWCAALKQYDIVSELLQARIITVDEISMALAGAGEEDATSIERPKTPPPRARTPPPLSRGR